MTNIDGPFGLRPVRGPLELITVFIPSTDGTALFVGDPVVKTADGSNAVSVSVGDMTHDVGTLPIVTKATLATANAITGVIVGFENIAGSTGTIKHRPANLARTAIVNIHPDTVYEVQCDGALAPTSVGLNANLIQTHAGSAVTGMSGVELDTTVDPPAATAADQLLIVGVSKNQERNNTTTANTVVEVKLNAMTQDARDKAGI